VRAEGRGDTPFSRRKRRDTWGAMVMGDEVTGYMQVTPACRCSTRLVMGDPVLGKYLGSSGVECALTLWVGGGCISIVGRIKIATLRPHDPPAHTPFRCLEV
jgi:hypothetical protein